MEVVVGQNKDKVEVGGTEQIGEVQIADEVVAAIAGYAALEVDGVQDIATKFSDAFSTKVTYKGVRIQVKDASIYVDMAIYVKYGYSIPKVSAQVQEKVVTSIKSMIGLNCNEVNIRIAGISKTPED